MFASSVSLSFNGISFQLTTLRGWSGGCWVGLRGHVCVLRFARFQRVCEQMYLCPYSCALVPPKPPTNGRHRGRLNNCWTPQLIDCHLSCSFTNRIENRTPSANCVSRKWEQKKESLWEREWEREKRDRGTGEYRYDVGLHQLAHCIVRMYVREIPEYLREYTVLQNWKREIERQGRETGVKIMTKHVIDYPLTLDMDMDIVRTGGSSKGTHHTSHIAHCGMQLE